MFHRALEAVEVVLQAEEAAAPDVGHVISRVRAQESPVEDRDSRLRDGYEPPVHKGRAVRVRLVIFRCSPVLLHVLQIHFLPHFLCSWPSCDNRLELSSDAGRVGIVKFELGKRWSKRTIPNS